MREIEGGQILFTQGAWEIHAEFENSEWVEIFHHCRKWNPADDRVGYSYQIPSDTECPGCGKTQPDEIQALAAMHNMDRPAREYGQHLAGMLQREYNRIYAEIVKKVDSMCLTGNGVDE